MIDHVSLGVSDEARAWAFYDAVMGALGFGRAYDKPPHVGYGRKHPVLWIGKPHDASRPASPGHGVHVCLRAESREQVDRFHAAGLTGGGRDAGPPGLRPEYAANYYAAFLFDPDGNKIEAVCYLPT
ncbi:MAG: VOC family protein [Alphaproteobacteria bacterium]|nr:VOC family protein [Alphaproteobacteria bacterium]